jgi:ABC-type dipeptide/oligopeptide/nickel transport system permease subunit
VIASRSLTHFRRNRAAQVGLALVVLLVLFAVVGPWLASHDPYASDFAHGSDEATGLPAGPSARYWLGTDRLFRDQLARLAMGARLSLLIGVAATAISSLIGALVGITAGYYEGSRGLRLSWPVLLSVACAFVSVLGETPLRWALGMLAAGAALTALGRKAGIEWLLYGPRVNADVALMRLTDVGLSFPFLLLVLAIGTAIDRTTTTSILVVLGLTGWLGTARILRAKTLQIRALEYVEASRALGQGTAGVLLRHVLPNVAGPWIVVSTIAVAQMILAESVLSYLGAGISPPTPTWGHMLFDAQDYYAAAPWLVWGPGGAILLAVLGFNLLGEGLRDALDPRED